MAATRVNPDDISLTDPQPVEQKVPQSIIIPVDDEEDETLVVDVTTLEKGPSYKPPPPGVWWNCIQKQSCKPIDHRYPTTLEDLVQAVDDARAKKIQVRSVGSGHSFSNICPSDYMLLDFSLDPKSEGNMGKVLTIDPSTLKDPSQAEKLFAVESGIKIRDLNVKLNNKGKALATLGAYDGQTLAGAISTGTHGSMIDQGPIASLVRSLVLVSETGHIYQIEPSNGITDPVKFQPGDLNIKLKQDDDWFQSTVIAMGCMGIVYSYTLEVVPAFLLDESRTLDTWQSLRTKIADGLKKDYYEIDINPYLTKVKGQEKNVAIEIIRTIRDPKTTKKGGTRGIRNWLSGMLAKWDKARELLVDYLNTFPKASPGLISSALRTLQNKYYIQQSYDVFNLGAVDDVRAYAVELSFDATETDQIPIVVDKVIAAFQDAAQRKIGYLAGPFAVRFVKAADAFAAPQQGRFTMMVEMDMLDGIKTGDSLLKHMKETMGADLSFAGSMRVHWGLDLDTVDGNEVRATYPEWSRWLAVYDQLNTTGMWNGRFTERLGISR